MSGIFTSAFGTAAKIDPGKPVPLPRAMVNQQLTHDDAIYFNPEWPRDGRFVLCASVDGGNPGNGPSTLYLIDAATGRKKTLTTGTESGARTRRFKCAVLVAGASTLHTNMPLPPFEGV